MNNERAGNRGEREKSARRTCCGNRHTTAPLTPSAVSALVTEVMSLTAAARVSLWSSGGGVQSCAIAALIIEGRLPPPDLAAIADTHYEQSTTWEFLEFVQPRLPFEIVRVSANDYATVGLYGGKDKDTLLIPAFTNQSGEIGKLPAFCSNEWKRRVIERWARKKGVSGGEFWVGFSTDELVRVKAATGKWTERYPLIEQRMNRGDCIALVRRVFGADPPRSSCWMCPNHTQEEWRDIKENKPRDWALAVKFDKAIRKKDPHAFLHADCVPLEDADLSERNESLFTRCDSGNCFV